MTSEPAPASRDFGHHWKDPERTRRYVEDADRRQHERVRLFRLLADLAPFEPSDPVRILDIGSGHGPVAEALLDAFPNGIAIGLDVSEAMIAEGTTRMARFGARFHYHLGDIATGSIPNDSAGEFDIVVSAAATHHLPGDLKQTLYRSIFDQVRPGGCFFNLDSMSPQDPFLAERYQIVRERERMRAGEEAAPAKHGPRFAHFFEPVDDHLAWLEKAGFLHSHCFWKELGQALVGGFKGQ